MNTKSMKGIIFKSLSFVFCAIFFAFALVIAGEARGSEAALKSCFSGGNMYVQDDGGCDIGDWNAMGVQHNSTLYEETSTYSASSLNGLQQAQIANTNGNFLFNSFADSIMRIFSLASP